LQKDNPPGKLALHPLRSCQLFSKDSYRLQRGRGTGGGKKEKGFTVLGEKKGSRERMTAKVNDLRVSFRLMELKSERWRRWKKYTAKVECKPDRKANYARDFHSSHVEVPSPTYSKRGKKKRAQKAQKLEIPRQKSKGKKEHGCSCASAATRPP